MAAPVQLDHFGFPSSMVSPDQKGKEWCLKYLKAFHGEYSNGSSGVRILRYAMEDYAKYRSYAAGRQDINQYKKMLSPTTRKGKKDQSWRNLDWNILPILPTLVSVTTNKVLGQKKDIIIRGIDELSQNEERFRKNQIMTYVTNLPLIQQAEQMGVQVQSPLDPGTPMPATMQEVELLMQMYPKDRYVMELYDQIDRCLSLNNSKQVWQDVVTDFVEVGVGGTKTWIDITGMVRIRRVIPERLITNTCVSPDFSDLSRVGEYVQMTISELRASVPRGTFTEEDYAKMATKASGTSYSAYGIDAYFRTNYRYPYDNEKVLVLDAEWFSADDYAYVVEKSNAGNLNVNRQKDPYWLNRVKWVDENGQQKVGVTDEQYIEFNKKKGSDRVIERDSVNNLYGGKWIVGTDYIFDWGLKSNMQRSLNRLGDVRSNYNLYTFFDSYMRRAEPIADDIQMNWLQYQNMRAQAKPNGLAINKRALTSLTVAGKAGSPETLDELSLLQMYTETGNLIYKGEDAAGRPYPYDPIKELKGGINEAAVQYLEFIRNQIDMLRTIFGLNEATDSSTPNPKLGKAIAEMLEQNTNTALGTIYHAYSHVFEETIKSVALLVPDAEQIKSAAKDEALGSSSGDFFRANSDVTFREVGISIEDGPTSEIRQRLQKYIELSIAAKEIRPEDALLIENEPNLMRAYWMLAMKRRQKMQEDQEAQMQLYQAEQQKNIESATAAAQAKADADMQIFQAEMDKEMMLQPMKEKLLSMEIMGKIALAKIQAGATLEKADIEAISQLHQTLIKAASQEKIAEENRKKAAQQKSQAKKTA
jgi:hypothetical protein